MKKNSNNSDNTNNLSYLDNYEEINKFKKKSNPNLKKNKNIILSRYTRWFIFVLFILLAILMNFDHGTVPAATSEIKSDLDINDTILGIFGSLVFLGNMIGIICLFIRFVGFIYYYKSL